MQQSLEHCLPTLLKTISEGVVFIDLLGNITSCNRAASRIFEIPTEEFLTSNYLKHFNDTLFGFSVKELLASQSSAEKIHYIRFHSPSGVDKELEVSPTLTAEGLLLIIADKSEIRHLQVSANRSSRLKDLGGMAALLAHEIRNPLGGIKGFAALLKRDLADRPELRQMAEFIVDGTDNLNKLVTHILNYAHPFQTHMEPVDLIALIQDLKNHLSADEALMKNIRFEIHSPHKTLPISMDKQLMRSALLNLCVNAIQAMPEGGTLTVEADRGDQEVTIKITDTGIGIPAANLKKIFTAFFTTKTEGNGFGLLEVNKVIQAHGGSIDVASVEGKGSTFTLKIPVSHVY